MENFDNFMNHRVDTEYMHQGFSVDLGSGYSFATDGKYPVVRKLVLSFTGYKWYLNEEKNIDTETNKNINNMGTLRDFYLNHLTHKVFLYNHPSEGPLEVRFYEPLKLPKGLKEGNGVVEDFEIVLIQVI